jgi:DNA-binding NarL/FixJ family response regulator
MKRSEFSIAQVGRSAPAEQGGPIQTAVILTGPTSLEAGQVLHLLSQDTSCPLTGKQLEAIRHLSTGLTYNEIAPLMNISVSTVRTHLFNAYDILGVHDRAQAVLRCSREGWL